MVLGIGLISCAKFVQPEIGTPDFSKAPKPDATKLAHAFEINGTIPVSNPNKYGFKIKTAGSKLYVNDEELGLITLADKVKIKKLSNESYDVNLLIKPDKNIKSKVTSIAMASLFKKDLKFRLEGVIIAKKFVFRKKVPINIEKNIDLNQLKNKLKN